jgi:ribulose 1,5-bisphosphate synthetase/thiazole synthase
MRYITEPKKQLPIYGKFDVVVCGGGPAGIGASLSAARNGAKTIIIEQTGCLGGMSTA